jgi:hypothetical protein
VHAQQLMGRTVQGVDQAFEFILSQKHCLGN